jgi:hypothetical protein
MFGKNLLRYGYFAGKKLEYNVLFSNHLEISTGFPYQKFEKITNIIPKVISENLFHTILNLKLHAGQKHIQNIVLFLRGSSNNM